MKQNDIACMVEEPKVREVTEILRFRLADPYQALVTFGVQLNLVLCDPLPLQLLAS